MEILVINKNLIQYRFTKILDRVSYYISIYAFIKDKNVLLIDTGYYNYGKMISNDLKNNNYKVDTIIITHFHKDHGEGISAFECDNIIGSKYYQPKLFSWNLGNNNEFKTPKILVSKNYTFNFYDSNIDIFSTPGHTKDSLSILIDSKYLFTGDLLLEDINGKMIIPAIDLDSNPKDLLNTLKSLNSIKFEILFFSHGTPFKFDKIKYKELLNNRIFYLNKFIDSNYEADVEECLLNNSNDYSLLEMHRLNKRNVKKLKI